MSGIDNRIVTMKFDNRSFEQNAATSLSTLQKLKESMSFKNVGATALKGLSSIGGAVAKIGKMTPFAPLISAAEKGFGAIGGFINKIGIKNPFSSSIHGANELQRAAQSAGGPAGMGYLEGGVTAVSGKFVALTTIAVTALSNITNKAINATTAWVKSFTIAPIMDGLHEYETTLQSIQTVQANTDQPLPKIEKALKDLNDYSDTTIYNFGEMAKNVGTFTAAGVNLEDSVASIKGIANVAALSGSNSQQAAGAMYQLSQAIAAGKVGAQDWNSVVNAGMAGKKLQTALATTGELMGTLNKGAMTFNKQSGALQINGNSFKNSIMSLPGQTSWLTSGVLVNSLAMLDGRFSVAYQKAQLLEDGTRKFSDAQIKANMAVARQNMEQKLGHKFSTQQYADLLKMAEMATKSAQDVKTLGQVFDIAKETIGSGWSASFKSIFGNLEESKTLFTEMSTGLGDIIRGNALARNNLLASWKSMGGRDTLIDGLKDAWQSFYSVLQAVGKGFRDIFPRQTPAGLLGMTKAFADFMHSLLPSKETLADIQDIAGGVFAVFGIGKQLLGGVVTLFKTLFSTVGGGNGDFLNFAAGLGNTVKSFNTFLEESGLVTAFFTGLGKILSVPLALLRGVAGVFGGIFEGFNSGAADQVGEAFDAVGKRMSGLQAIGEHIRNFFSSIGEYFGDFGAYISDALMGIGDMVAGAFTADTFGSTLDVINTTLLGGIVLMIKSFFNKGLSIDLTGGLFAGIKQTLGEATSAFENMQNTLKADILMKIAAAIGVMAAALLVLSMIDPGALTKALGAMGAGFGILITAMAVMMKVMGPASILQLYVISSAMTKMAVSILLLALALKTLSNIKFGEMLRGLLGLGVMLKLITKAIIPLAAGSKGMAKAATSLVILGVALNILAIALKIFASMSWEEMAKGLLSLAATLAILSVALRAMPDMKTSGFGLLLLAGAMNVLAVALKIFATMSWPEMAKGLIMLAGSLAIIAGAIRLMPKSLALQAAGLLVVAGAMTVLSGALKVMGSMGWESIAKGLITMAGALVIIGLALQLYGVTGVLGAAALVVTAAAMTTLLPVLLAFGAMDWMTILKSLTMLAGVFTVLGVAGLLLAPVTPVIMALGAALLVMGAGLALAGAGALAAATAFGIVVAAGAVGIQVLAELLRTVIAAIPAAMGAFGRGIVNFAKAIANGGPAFVKAMSRIVSNMLDAVIRNVPKMGKAFMAILNTGLRVISTMSPRIFAAGIRLILGFLNAIDRNIGKIVNVVSSLIVKFLNALAKNLPRVIQAGVNFIIKFINGLSKAIDNNADELGRAGGRLAMSIVTGMASGLRGAVSEVAGAARHLAESALGAIHDVIKNPPFPSREGMKLGRSLGVGLAVGIGNSTGDVETSSRGVAHTAIQTLQKTLSDAASGLSLDPNMNPTITPVLDLSALTKEANKMSSILATAPIMPTVSYQAAADISTATQASDVAAAEALLAAGGGGDTYVNYEQHLHSPTPIDSVTTYRASKSLLSLKKEELTGS